MASVKNKWHQSFCHFVDWYKISKMKIRLGSIIFLALSAAQQLSLAKDLFIYDSTTGVKNLTL